MGSRQRMKTTETKHKRNREKEGAKKCTEWTEINWKSMHSCVFSSCTWQLACHPHTFVLLYLRRPSLTLSYYKCPHSRSTTLIGPPKDSNTRNAHTLPVHRLNYVKACQLNIEMNTQGRGESWRGETKIKGKDKKDGTERRKNIKKGVLWSENYFQFLWML